MQRPRATGRPCRRPPRPDWTCSPNDTPEKRWPSLPHDHFDHNGTDISSHNGPAGGAQRGGLGGAPPWASTARRALRLGIGGPVGSGKTALVAALCQQLRQGLALAVVTNDIYTTEDADFLRRAAVLPDQRIRAVRTGCCPHTAIRDDITANLEAADDLERDLAPLDLLIFESGGGKPTAPFRPGRGVAPALVLCLCGGGKGPPHGRPPGSLSDLLGINK